MRCAQAIIGMSLLVAVDGMAQDFDIIRQEISVDLTGATTVLDNTIVVQALAATGSFDTYTPAVPIDLVEVDGVPAAWNPNPQEPEYVTGITLPQPLAVGDQARVRVVASGTLDCSFPDYPDFAWCTRTTGETLLTPSDFSMAWYHVSLGTVDPFVGTLRVRVPTGQTVVATQGPATSIVDAPDGTSTWHFTLDLPTDMLGLYAGTRASVTSSGGIPVTGYFNDSVEHRAKMQVAVDLSSAVIGYLNEAYVPAITREATIVTTAPSFIFGGMGLYANVYLGEPVIEDFDYLLEQGVAHEFSHTWWGGIASAADFFEGGGFFSEAFAQYSSWRALGHIYDESVRDVGVRTDSVWYMYGRPGDRDIAVLSPGISYSDLRVHVVYHKAATFLRTLEEALGVDGFTAALRALLRDGYGHMSTARLVEAIAAETGTDVEPEVDQWLRRTGFPILTVESRVFEAAGVRVQLIIDNPKAFALAVPVRLVLGDGSIRDEKISVTAEPMSTVTFDLPHRPLAVQLDPHWTLVREIRPALLGDVTLDGEVDAADLIEVALHQGGAVPSERRVDGKYDPLFDVDANRRIDATDLETVALAVAHSARSAAAGLAVGE